MLVGVISDTHDNLERVDRAVRVLNERGVELVIHCGDYVAPFVLKRLGALEAKLVGVFGNNDGDKVLLLRAARELGFELHGQPHELELAGRRVLVLHGVGDGRMTRAVVRALAERGGYDVILYGHTHRSEVARVGGALVVNPGEVFGMLYGRSTLALVDLERLEAEVVEL